ncbi:beta strand repeat-containing protein [Mesorhizobium sp. B2-8-5]|uniref:beta strand repeat-containing protein n=1 Tax=Mesorhizobium sp. B2-8-5 TaxID=2589903 RepID=UPI001D01801D|nr:VCBS domain-containing protein [Mesorhizobium sp. B2-8-5]UCI27762.1 VCBS domain-containing protein [Mesorhizobium sp. B2-8-5]
MATTTVSGSTVTFSNSGAAADLTQSGTEDGSLQFTFDVLAASGGGTKTTIYSVDDGTKNDDGGASITVTNKAFADYNKDLLIQDQAGIQFAETSANGAKFWIGSDNKIHYDATAVAPLINALGAGEHFTDTIQYTIKMSNGTLSVGTLSVVINGVNDAAVITGTSTAELTETDAAQNTGGKLDATDVDSSAAFVTQTDADGSNGYGKFSIAADGTWTYAMNNAHNEFVGGQDYTDSITVATADGTSKVLTVTIHGTNDAAVITGTSTAELTETDAAQNTGGKLDATDVDSSAAFVTQTDADGSNGYGKFSIAADGTWTYAMNNAHNEFVGGQDYTDSITVATADGTSKVLTVTIHGTNDAAVITGTSTAELTETDAAQNTGGKLDATDVDSSAAFVTQTNADGSNGYGKFSIAADGTWTYAMNNAHNEFVGGQDYTDSITVATADGTSKVLTVTIHGTNDAAVITGTSTAELTETDAAQNTGGKLDATDVDSSAAFVTQTNADGSNGYGKFSIAADGTWTYAMNNAHNEFVGGQDYTDSITVATADGTSKVLTVTIHGTNDAAVITGTSTAELTETDAAQNTGGKLDATDVDSSAAFVTQTDADGSNGYGKFSIAADGTWTYAMNNAHNEFVGGQDYTDSITVATADGTSKVLTVTIHGTNDAAVITGTSTAELTETDAAQNTGGKLDATDVDSSAAFVTQTNADGSNGYGKFSIAADGTWTYAMNNAHNEFVGGQDYTDSITVATADGTSKVLTVTIHGTNDAAVITGTSTAELTETDAAQNTGGKLDATDVDSSAAFVTQTNADGSNGYGKFSIAADGTWTYAMNNAHNEFVGGQDYTDSITVATADGTSKVLTVTIHGTNDAAVITGTSTAELTETDAAQNTGGKLDATDVDSSAAFVTQTNADGSNGYGKFSIAADGTWTYAMNNAHNEFVGGQDYTDSITVATADGTSKVLTVTIHGTNDAAVITGTSTAELTETDAAQNTGGKLDATDVDSSAAFVTQTDADGSNGYGKFSIAADGTWTYAMNNAHNEFVGGQDYTDSITVATADGTSKVLTVTIHGTNDAAVITGTSTAELTETDAAQNTGGKLDATDVDSSAAFVTQTDADGSNGYGKFSIAADGTWTYAMNNAHNEFVGGQDYTDSITVATADGTSKVLTVTIHGTNDAAVITGMSTAELTETDAAQNTGGKLDATDVDSSAAFVTQTNADGSNGYGKFSIAADGTWTYAMNNAHNEFVGGQDYTDSITVATADGTSKVLTVTIHGTNDAAVITGMSSGSVTEDAVLTVNGALTVNDPDAGQNSFQVHNGSNPVAGTYGSLTIDAGGNWVYTLNNAAANVQALTSADHPHDQIHVLSADGTDHVIDITVNGANEPVTNHAPSAPVFVPSSAPIADGNAIDLGHFFSVDPDAGDSVQYSALFTLGSGNLNSIGVDSNSGELTASVPPGQVVSGTLTVTATDNHAASSSSQTFNVWIGNGSSSGNDGIVLSSTNPNIADGRAGADGLTGSSGVDYIFGGSGNDTIKGLGGADWLSGGAGDDHFRFEAVSDSTHAAFDTILDFQHGTGSTGHDFIDFASTLGLTTTGTVSGGNLAAHTVAWQSDGSGNMIVYANTGSSIESVTGGAHIIEIHLMGVSTLTANDFTLSV